ncbi:hypothetical protein F8388_019803 [Cannabis sativa]|uniref:50S ribosomal protein L16, chloroplastic n=1 Tax=Cannabis sativa TaxID=3483 RepID=A0A7J6HLW7_CANSA|nr:hypothetical protein F8388_019803 [Cannabis sativa]
MKKAIELTEQAATKGIQIQIAGRIDGKEIARVEWIREGRVPLQTIRAKIDYCSYTVGTIYGIDQITSRQIEAGRRAMTQNARRGGKIWVRIFPDKPVTVRPTETRMGSGKGFPEYWVAVVKPGRILYEMSGDRDVEPKEKEAIPNTPLERSEVIRAVIVRTGKELKHDNDIPRSGSRKNKHTGSRKNARRIPKGVIHVQASFNNTIVTVTDVRGRVISWSSAGTCGFKGTRRGTPFAAQTVAGNAIRTVVDQGMQQAEVMIKGPGLGRDAALRAIRRSEKVIVSTRPLQWKCVESRADSKSLYYGRFILAPLMRGQADTIGIVMRRALLGEIEGTCITRAKSNKIPHEYSNIVGIQESVHEILMNLKEIVLRSNLYGTREASICVKGPGYVTAQDIILQSSVEIVDNT